MLQSTLVSSKRRASRVPINGTSFPINSRNIDCFNENTGQSSLQQQQLAVDCASNSVFTASISRASTTKSNCNSLLIHKHTQNTTSYSLSSSLFCSVPIEEAEEQQESLACFDVIEDTLCIAFKQSGLIASLSTVSSTSSSSDDSSCSLDNYEIVAKIESGIACMKWSPDLEVCVIVSHSLKLLLLSRDYDLIYEVVLGSANADSTLHAEQVPVNVGWGKKETQFHGSAGKAAAMEKRTDVYVKADQDDRNDVQIDWRGDANYFVVSAAIDGVRSLRVYNREAILQSLSEPVNNLHQTLSWRPSGNLIAVSQTYTTKIQKVVFFERNGLQHGEFELVNEAPSTTRVVQLTWNLDSTILAVWVERRRSRENTDYLESAILLYTCSNYHYYLAREVRCGKLDSFASIKWDPETANRLHTLTTAGMVKTDNFIFSTYKSTSLSPESPATVAVIDGNILHLTPFKYANTPPPYSHSQVTLPTSANALLASLNGPDRIAVLACDGSIFLVEPQSKQDWRLGYKIVETLNSADIADKVIRADVDADAAPPSIPERIFWIAETLLVVVFDGCVVVCGIKKRVEDEGCIHLETAAVLPFDGCLLECVFDDHQTGFLEVEDGTVYKVWCQDNGKWRMTHFIKFPHPCPLIAPIQLKISEDDYSSSLESLQDTDHVVAAVTEPHLLGQTTTNKLYLDTQIISQDCLSFSAHSEFIIWTALNHHLWTIETGEIKDLHQSVSSLAKMDSNSRRVERGAKIVCAVPGDISVVLMMPRGNLESVCPRPFVLSAVRQALDAKQYRTAFALCRKHRIDLNILYDHAPAAFLEHVLEFVKGVAVPEYLNLFLSGLRNENITESMYPHPCYQKKAGNASLVGETHNNVSKAAASAIVVDDIDDEATFVCKIDRVCAAIRGALQQAASSNSSKYTTCILTTFVKMNEPDLESSMRLIKQIKETLSVEAADQALKYVIFLVNVEALYNVALGMYDFGLVVMVAQQSQKDPREYLPFLTELSKLEKFQQRFRIDDYLGRKEKALINLKQDGDHGACMAYMIKNRLFKTGMTLFEEGSVEFKDVMKAYAHHLFDSREYLDSATLYRSAGFYQKALEAYIEATAWQEALSVIYQVEDGEAKIRDVCTQLIESLEEQYAYESAATIYFEYLLDPESGIKQLCKGYYFTQAVRKAQILRQPVLIAEIIQPAVYAAHVTLKEEIEMAIETVGKQRDRLIQVRVEKAKRLLELSLMPHNEDLNDIEIMSDTSSMATTRISAYSRTNTATTSNQSHASVRSNMSSRTKRKLEKKKHSSKKGGVFEEEFLVNSLIKAAERLKTLNLEVGNVATSMLMFPNSNVMATAREFEAKFQQLDRLLRKSMFKVYPHLAQVVEASRKKKTDDVAEDVATEPLIMPPVESTMPTIPDNVLEFVMIQTNPIKDTTSDLRPAFLKNCSHPALMISGRDPTITTITAAFEKMTAATTLSKGVSEEITPDANLQTSSKEEEREGEGGEAAAAGSTAEDQTPISNSVQSAHYRPAPTVKLYVGNLDTRVVDEDLQRLFPLACSVKIVIPATPAAANGETTSAASSSTKPNFGFIEFQHQSDAHTALNATNGTRLYDLDIKVNWAFANGNKPHSSSSSSHYHVFVGDLGPEVDDGMLIKEFGGFPSLSEARVMWDSTSGKSRGYGFVAFRDRAEADQCIETMNGRQLGTRAIRCNWANQKVSSAFSSSSAGSAASQQQHYHQPHTSKYNRYQNGSGGGGGYNSHHLNSGSSSPGGAHIGNSHLYYVPPEAGVLKYEDVVVQTSTYNTTVYVGNLSPQTTETDLNEAFIQFGNIIDMKSQFDRGFAFIKFDNHDSAAFAIVTNNAIELQGRPMKCSWGKDRTPGYNGGGVGSYRHNNNGNYGAVGATGGVAGIHNPYIAQMSFQGMHPDAHQMTGYPPEAFAYSPTGAYSPYGFYYPAAALPPTSVVGDGFDVSLSGVGGEGDAAEVGYDQSNAASNTSATNGAEAEAGGIVFGSGEVEVPLKNLANRSSNENGWAGWWNRQQYNQQQQPQLQQQQQQEQQKE